MKSEYSSIFKACAASWIPYYIAEGLEECCSAVDCKLKCLACKMTQSVQPN